MLVAGVSIADEIGLGRPRYRIIGLLSSSKYTLSQKLLRYYETQLGTCSYRDEIRSLFNCRFEIGRNSSNRSYAVIHILCWSEFVRVELN